MLNNINRINLLFYNVAMLINYELNRFQLIILPWNLLRLLNGNTEVSDRKIKIMLK